MSALPSGDDFAALEESAALAAKLRDALVLGNELDGERGRKEDVVPNDSFGAPVAEVGHAIDAVGSVADVGRGRLAGDGSRICEREREDDQNHHRAAWASFQRTSHTT